MESNSSKENNPNTIKSIHTAEVPSIKSVTDKYEISPARRALSQVLAVMVKNTLLLTLGMLAGYPTILMPRLLEEKSETNLHITQEEESWIGSIGFMCVPIGSVLSGVITKPLGRKKCMQLVCVLFFAATIGFRFFIYHFWQMYLALGIMGLSSGLSEAPVVTYVAEITQPSLRGILSGTGSLSIGLGIFCEFILGTFFHWRTVGLINAGMPVVSFVLLFIIPESPQWLIMKNKLDDGRKSLAWLRGWTTVKDVENEFDVLVAEEKNRTLKSQVKEGAIGDYCKKDFLKPLALLLFVVIMQSISGYSTTQRFAVEIFAALKAPIDRYYATIIYGGVQLLGSLLCIMIIHSVGKRVLILSALTIGGFCTILVAIYAFMVDIKYIHNAKYLKPYTEVDAYNWIPLVGICAAAFALQCGFIVPWILSGELFPRNISPIGSATVSAVSNISVSIACKTFLQMVSGLTLAVTFWFYGAVCIFIVLVLYFCLPETEGKTLQEITDHFAGVSKLDNKVRTKQTFEKQSVTDVEK